MDAKLKEELDKELITTSAYRKPKRPPKIKFLSSKALDRTPYNLFLDDKRSIKDVTWMSIPDDYPWRVARSYSDFIKTIETCGLPQFISYDHDLCEEHYAHGSLSHFSKFDYAKVSEKTGMCCAKWLVQYCFKNKKALPAWQSHTMNPCGRANIDGLLKRFKDFQAESKECGDFRLT